MLKDKIWHIIIIDDDCVDSYIYMQLITLWQFWHCLIMQPPDS